MPYLLAGRVEKMSSRIFGFATTDSVKIICQCGTMEGRVEFAHFGMRILFDCRDCNTSVLMEVTQ